MYKNYYNNRIGFVPFILGAAVGGGVVSYFNPYRPRPTYYYPYYPY